MLTSLTWDGGTPAYDGSTAVTYVFTGTLTMTPGITNPGNLTASVIVIMAAAPVVTYTVSVSAEPPEGGRVSEMTTAPWRPSLLGVFFLVSWGADMSYCSFFNKKTMERV